MYRVVSLALVISLLLVVGVTAFTFSQESEQITITTYYPSPYGVYKQLRLYPSNTPPGDCDANSEGSLYYDNTTGQKQVKVCTETSPGNYSWQPLGAFW